MKEPAKKRGRPRIYLKKRGNLTTRLRPEIRKQLDRAAELSCRSLSEEVEFRLEMSFRKETGNSSYQNVLTSAEVAEIINRATKDFLETIRPS